MTWRKAAVTLSQQLYESGLPETRCSACKRTIPRRTHRMTLRPSWHDDNDHLCTSCWEVILEWARRFALQQMEPHL